MRECLDCTLWGINCKSPLGLGFFCILNVLVTCFWVHALPALSLLTGPKSDSINRISKKLYGGKSLLLEETFIIKENPNLGIYFRREGPLGVSELKLLAIQYLLGIFWPLSLYIYLLLHGLSSVGYVLHWIFLNL